MPSTTDERRARWSHKATCPVCGGTGEGVPAGRFATLACKGCDGVGSCEFCDESKAMALLESHGYKLTHKHTWIKPAFFHRPTADEFDAIQFLIEEWDWGGFEPMSPPGKLIHTYDGPFYHPNH